MGGRSGSSQTARSGSCVVRPRSQRTATAHRSASTVSSRLDFQVRPRCSTRAADQPTRTPCSIVFGRRCFDWAQTAEADRLDARGSEPLDDTLAPDPRLPREPPRRLQLRDMPTHHALMKIEPDTHRRQRHHAQPSDEPSDPQSSRTQSRPLRRHPITLNPCPCLAAVRPAWTLSFHLWTRLAADYPNPTQLSFYVGRG
jgi:hypothetical protein